MCIETHLEALVIDRAMDLRLTGALGWYRIPCIDRPGLPRYEGFISLNIFANFFSRFVDPKEYLI